MALSGLLAGLLLYLFSWWVPISDGFYDEWRQGNLFIEIQPRALLGTIANLFHFEDRGFTLVKIAALWLWLSLIIVQLTQCIRRPASSAQLYQWFCVCCLFAFSTVAQVTFGPVMLIDIIAYLFIVLVFLNLTSSAPITLSQSLINTLLLTAAVATHEKSVFDIAILFLWLFYKKGFIRSALVLGPGIFSSILFLLALRSKRLTGETLDTYIDILHGGSKFLSSSFSLIEVLIGLGALGVLYLYLSICFISSKTSLLNGYQRTFLVLGMFLLCLAPLTVAWDTNRLVGLIWLPTLILLVEAGKEALWPPSAYKMIFLSMLCLLQLAIPPILRFPPNVVIAYNNYAQYIYGDKAVRIEAPVRKRESLLFKDKAKGSTYLKLGWGSPESWGVWSTQPTSVITFDNFDPQIKQISLRFNAMIAPQAATQNLSIYANEQFVGKFPITQFNDNLIRLEIPKREYRSLNLRLELDKLYSPAKLGISAEDHRQLGIGLMAIEFQ
jgi:hypothetical protein